MYVCVRVCVCERERERGKWGGGGGGGKRTETERDVTHSKLSMCTSFRFGILFKHLLGKTSSLQNCQSAVRS